MPVAPSSSVPPLVAWVITTDSSSADIAAIQGQGGRLVFIGKTETVLLTDASLSVGPDTNPATIQRLYEGLLGRGAETAGISLWNTQLSAGTSKAAVANSLLNSAEFVSAHGTQTDQQFVTALYQGVLGRPPEAAGLALWTGQLDLGLSRGDLAVAIADSDEAKTHLASATAEIYLPDAAGTLVHELFETGLGREADLPSLAYFKSALATLAPPQFAAEIAGSAEFMAGHAGQANDAYINSLYQAGLGRSADAGGLATWTGALNAGASRSDVLLAIGTSAEAGAHLTHNLSV